jgi:hypothetical protein
MSTYQILPNYQFPTLPSVVEREILNEQSSIAEVQLAVCALNEPLRFGYGLNNVGGLLLQPIVDIWDSAYLLLPFIVGRGPIESIDAIRFEADAISGSISTHLYLGGTGQAVDSWLQAAWAHNWPTRSYVDTLDGIAWGVLRIPSSLGSVITNLIVTAKMLKVRQTEAGARVYSTNPAYALADFLTSTEYGRGETLDWSTVTTVAAVNDQSIAGNPRRAFGVMFDTVRTLDDIEETLRAYAGCWVVREGGVVRLVPDAPATSVFAFTNAGGSANYVSDSLRLSLAQRKDTPTLVTIKYTDTSVYPWREASFTEYAAWVKEGITPWRESVVSMPGIQDVHWARREALRRLNEYIASDLTVTMTAFGEAAQLRRGDVVSVTDSGGLTAKAFRLVGHQPTALGMWAETLKEYDPVVYSDAVATAGSSPDTTLPGPNNPPTVTLASPAVTEDVFQVETGLWGSRLRLEWIGPAVSFPFVQFYVVEVRSDVTSEDGSIVYMNALVDSATCTSTATEFVTKQLPENKTYTVSVAIISSTGVRGAFANSDFTNNGKQGIPKDFESLTGYEIGGEVRLSWSDKAYDGGPIDLDWSATELRYSVTGGTWANATLIDRVAAPSIRYNTKAIPPGTWKFWARPLDSVRSNQDYPNGQPSDGSHQASFQITVTSDSGAFIADSYTFVTPTLYNMTHHILGDGSAFWVTDMGDIWNSTYTVSPFSTYAIPLVNYHSYYYSGLVTEVKNHGIVITGDWITTTDYSFLALTGSVFLDLNSVGGEATKTITGATNGTPIVITSVAHGYTSLNEVLIAGVGGNTAANGRFLITVLTADTFSLQDLCGNQVAGNGTYTSGGTSSRWVWIPYAGGNAKGSGQYSRIRYFMPDPNATLLVNSLGSIKINVVARHEAGTVTTAASGPTIVSFANKYNAAVSASASPGGTVAGTAVYDSIEVSQGRGINVGYALKFVSANGHYVTCGNFSTHNFGNGTNLPFSMECWYRAESFVSNSALINRSTGLNAGEYRLMMTSVGSLAFHLVDNTAAGRIMVNGNTKLAVGTWYHVAATYDGSGTGAGVKLYIDGVQDTTVVTTGGAAFAFMRSTTAALEFGRWAPSTYADGRIDDVRLWNTERTQAQIVANKDVLLGGSESGLVGYWKFDEGSGTTATDSTSNAKNGTLTGTSGVPLYRPYNGMDVYRFNNAGTQIAGVVGWDFQGV